MIAVCDAACVRVYMIQRYIHIVGSLNYMTVM